jgi:hypothetical protein
MYTHWLRTIDEAFEISVSFLILTFLVAVGGAWLYERPFTLGQG